MPRWKRNIVAFLGNPRDLPSWLPRIAVIPHPPPRPHQYQMEHMPEFFIAARLYSQVAVGTSALAVCCSQVSFASQPSSDPLEAGSRPSTSWALQSIWACLHPPSVK